MAREDVPVMQSGQEGLAQDTRKARTAQQQQQAQRTRRGATDTRLVHLGWLRLGAEAGATPLVLFSSATICKPWATVCVGRAGGRAGRAGLGGPWLCGCVTWRWGGGKR